ncbi:MAG TPA: hypothetical protein VFA60_06045 [Terriglobales bacterium]|nr:hypothetical protein [Terriglobales bacterium]
MKKILATLVLLTCSALAQAPGQPAVSQDGSSRKARQLLDQMIRALGGQAYLNYTDVAQEGRTYGFSHGQSGSGAPFWRMWKWPDKERLELTKQRDWIIIHNGDKGFEITFRGVKPEEAEALKSYLERREFSLERVLRVWLNEPGTALFYDGQAVAQRKSTDKVTILNSKNQAVTLYLDIDSHLPIQKSYQRRDPTTREKDDQDEVYDNYHLVQGIQTPYSITRLKNGEMENQRFLNRVSYNNGFPDSMFEAAPLPPEKR